MPKKKSHKNQAISDMKALGVYKTEFLAAVEIYAGLREQYDVLTQTYIDGGYQYFETTESGTKKAPIVTTLESLRKDILSYASQLGLTPQGLLRVNDKAFTVAKKSGISKMLEGLGDGSKR